MNSMRTTAQYLLHVLAEFVRYNNVKENEMRLTLVDDELQKIDADIFRKFQLYFYKNLFDPEKNSKILHQEKLTKKTIETLLNEIFILDRDENKCRVCEF